MIVETRILALLCVIAALLTYIAVTLARDRFPMPRCFAPGAAREARGQRPCRGLG